MIILKERDGRAKTEYLWEKKRDGWHCLWFKDDYARLDWQKFEEYESRLDYLCDELEIENKGTPQKTWPENKFTKLTKEEVFAILL